MHPAQTIFAVIGVIISTTHRASSTTDSTSATTTLLPPLVNASTPPADCQDTINTCPNYGRAPCIEKVYEPWARSHCARFCGFCTSGLSSDCQDQLPNCDEYDSGTLCTSATYYAWAYGNCRGYCKFDQCGGACKDLEGIDCQSANEKSNLCADINRAKHVCPKFCNLCDVVDGLWSTWSAWSGCSVTCGNGTQVRTRSCDNPAPAHGGLACLGSVAENQPCLMQACLAVDAMWAPWSAWSGCSVTCGYGTQVRTRSCDNPAPAHGGLACLGSVAENQPCLMQACLVDTCRDDPGFDCQTIQSWCTGTSYDRLRALHTCPKFCNMCVGACKDQEGIDCQSANETSNLCADINRAKHVCPKFCNICDVVDAMWSPWSAWSGCSVTCGYGTQVRTRSCDNPAPVHGGLACLGSVAENQPCLMQACLVDTCRDDPGFDCQSIQDWCTGTSYDRLRALHTCPKFCKMCDVNGMWSTWSIWSDCNVAWGYGTQVRTRNCDNPAPENYGRYCHGSELEKQSC